MISSPLAAAKTVIIKLKSLSSVALGTSCVSLKLWMAANRPGSCCCLLSSFTKLPRSTGSRMTPRWQQMTWISCRNLMVRWNNESTPVHTVRADWWNIFNDSQDLFLKNGLEAEDVHRRSFGCFPSIYRTVYAHFSHLKNTTTLSRILSTCIKAVSLRLCSCGSGKLWLIQTPRRLKLRIHQDENLLNKALDIWKVGDCYIYSIYQIGLFIIQKDNYNEKCDFFNDHLIHPQHLLLSSICKSWQSEQQPDL